jgi:hypothetical protein
MSDLRDSYYSDSEVLLVIVKPYLAFMQDLGSEAVYRWNR